MITHHLRLLVISFAVLFAGVSLAQEIPLINWSVPPYIRASSGITTMTDVTPPRAFIGIQPCRIADTRGNGAPIQGGIFANGQTRTWDVTGLCGLPFGVDAISANFTVTGSPSAPPGAILTAWPTGQPQPTASILNFQAGQTIANAAILPLGSLERINVAVSHSTHVILDVNGYFSEEFGNLTPGFTLISNSNADTIHVENYTGPAIRGMGGYGVIGQSLSQATNAAGVAGLGQYRGISGESHEINNAAGVFGKVHFDLTVLDSYSAHGVRGEGLNGGVIGISPVEGTSGSLLQSGHEIAYGVLGLSGPWAVFAGGNFGATGTKNFLDPHPTDPDVSIAYISLEGPEAGTYFRGRAKFQNGIARIPVPEHFRFVTHPEGLTVQITPIGAMASFAVMKLDLNEIVVQASRNVEFSYLVQGVRATFKDAQPVRRTGDFRPRSADARMPEWLSPAQKRMLIQNGTYREDGAVNLETARRVGWDKVWEKRSQPSPQPE